jgi:hypothetical protein
MSGGRERERGKEGRKVYCFYYITFTLVSGWREWRGGRE